MRGARGGDRSRPNSISSRHQGLNFVVAVIGVKIGDQLINLSFSEGKVFHYLYSRLGEYVPRAEIDRDVFGTKVPGLTNNAEVVIHELRKKLRAVPDSPISIVNRPKHGYRMVISDALKVRW